MRVFIFTEPHLDLVEQELTDILWERIGEQFRAFVGLTAFEDLCPSGRSFRRALAGCR